MKKYSVLLLVDATAYVEVEAENEEQAKEKALNIAPNPRLCHQCGKELDVGEIVGVIEAIEIDA